MDFDNKNILTSEFCYPSFGLEPPNKDELDFRLACMKRELLYAAMPKLPCMFEFFETRYTRDVPQAGYTDDVYAVHLICAKHDTFHIEKGDIIYHAYAEDWQIEWNAKTGREIYRLTRLSAVYPQLKRFLKHDNYWVA